MRPKTGVPKILRKSQDRSLTRESSKPRVTFNEEPDVQAKKQRPLTS